MLRRGGQRGGEFGGQRPRRLLAASTWSALAAALAAAVLLELILGSVRIPLRAVLALLVGRVERETWRTIVVLFRLPRALTAALAGAALAVSGLQMQTLFRNPLAGPTILGIGSGASLGVALVVFASSTTDASLLLQGLGRGGEMAVVAAAGAGSGMVLLLVLAVSRRVKSVITLLILGLLFGYAVSGVVSILMHFAIAERIQTYISWTFGSFGGTTWRQLGVFVPVVGAGVAAAQFARKPLNGLLLGESYARSMGVRIRRSRVVLIITTAVMAGTVTAFCGPVAFLGVAVPHLCRSLFGTSDHRVLLPSCALLGATTALVSDLVAQLPGSQIVLPLNAVTALVGAPVIGWVILRRRNTRETFAT
jgi:iron complex transport system permease protein